jgi:hypothetical protein
MKLMTGLMKNGTGAALMAVTDVNILDTAGKELA